MPDSLLRAEAVELVTTVNYLCTHMSNNYSQIQTILLSSPMLVRLKQDVIGAALLSLSDCVVESILNSSMVRNCVSQ